jgi:hypothetical protein
MTLAGTVHQTPSRDCVNRAVYGRRRRRRYLAIACQRRVDIVSLLPILILEETAIFFRRRIKSESAEPLLYSHDPRRRGGLELDDRVEKFVVGDPFLVESSRDISNRERNVHVGRTIVRKQRSWGSL